MEFTKEQLIGYAAGLFDGEGCITTGYGKSGSRRGCRVQINMTDLTPLKKFQEAVGVGQIYGPYESASKKKEGKYKQFWVWNAQKADEVLKVFEIIGPYLCERRQIKIVEFTEILKQVKPMKKYIREKKVNVMRSVV